MLRHCRLVHRHRLGAQAAPRHAPLAVPPRHIFARPRPQPPRTRMPPRLAAFASTHGPARPPRTASIWRAAIFRRRSPARFGSSQATEAPTARKSLSARMKDMSRKYGWTVTGIYLGLSALDFPFCFLAVRWCGSERVAGVERAVVDGFWRAVEAVVPRLAERRRCREEAEAAARRAADQAGDAAAAEDAKGPNQNPGIGTQLLLAYGVHKSLIFFRIPITLAITPKVVKTLRRWGWKVGTRATPKTT